MTDIIIGTASQSVPAAKYDAIKSKLNVTTDQEVLDIALELVLSKANGMGAMAALTSYQRVEL